jgi:hypothetical protein
MSEASPKIEVAFNIRRPFRTAVGWPARLIGVLQRRSNPYVVAVWNPEWKSEELHVYPASGKHTATLDAHPLDLEEIPDDEYWAWIGPEAGAPLKHTHAYIVKEENWPVNANPMRLDTMSMGTDLVRGWHLLHEGFDNKSEPRPLTRFTMYNDRTGDRFTVHFTPMDDREVGARDGK